MTFKWCPPPRFSFKTTTALWCMAARWTTPSWSVSSLSSTASPSGSSSWCSASPPPRRELSSSPISSGWRRSVRRARREGGQVSNWEFNQKMWRQAGYQHNRHYWVDLCVEKVHFIWKGFRGISMVICLLRCCYQGDTCSWVMTHICYTFHEPSGFKWFHRPQHLRFFRYRKCDVYVRRMSCFGIINLERPTEFGTP